MPERNSIDPRVKQELDALRLENQKLQVARRSYEEFPFVLRQLARIVRRKIRSGLSRLRSGERNEPSGARDTANFSSSFHAYPVRAAQPIAGPRPRVLHAIGNFYIGGSARLVVDLVERLGDGYEHVVLVRDNPPEPHYVGLQIHPVSEIRTPRDALNLLRKFRPDLIHVHFLGHHRHAYSRADWRWYDSLFRGAEEYGRAVIENINIPVAPYFSGIVRRYVFVSDYLRLLFGRDADPNQTIYPGSDFEVFSRSADGTAPRDCIGMVYRLEKDKLDESAIEVFIQVLRRRPGTRAIIVGGGRFLESYRTAVRRAGLAGFVTFTAYVDYERLPRLYEQMSLFVAPPHSESFGHVVPLAMGMGIPVVAYDIGALPEILGSDEALVPAGDVGALASTIVGLLDDPERRRRIGAENRDRARRLFSVEKMVDDYRALYENVLDNGAAENARVMPGVSAARENRA